MTKHLKHLKQILGVEIYLKQSAENRRKERDQFWLRLRHTVILILNGRTSASKEMNLMALIRNLRFLQLRSKEIGKNSTVFGGL